MTHSRPRSPIRLLMAVIIVMGVACVSRAGNFDMERVRLDAKWLSAAITRAVGEPEHKATRQQLHAEIRKLEAYGVQVWTQNFEVVVPRTRMVNGARQAIIRLDDVTDQPIFPLWPAGVRLNRTAEAGITGRPIYIDHGRLDQIPPRSIHDQIAVMEMTGGHRWPNAFSAGAQALILLGAPQVNFLDVSSHLLPIPVYCPRFYVPPGSLADALRQGTLKKVTLRCAVEWKQAVATNLYALVMPAPSAEKTVAEPAVAVVVRYDASGVVPDLAAGADAAVDIAVALNLLRYMSRHRPQRPVLWCFLDAYGINQLGLRQMMAALAVTDEDRRVHVEEDEQLLTKKYRPASELARQLEAPGQAIAHLHEHRFRLLDSASRRILDLEANLGPLRLATLSTGTNEQPQLAAQVHELEQQRRLLIAAQSELLRSQRSPVAFDSGHKALAESLWKETHDRVVGQAEEVEARLKTYTSHDQLRLEMLRALGLLDRKQCPISFVLGLDLSDAGTVVGPVSYDHYLHLSERPGGKDFERWLRGRSASELEAMWPPRLRRAVNLSPLKGLDSGASHVPGRQMSMTSAAGSFGMRAMTWATLDAPRQRVDTPNDTFERLTWRRLEPQIEATAAMVLALVSDSRNGRDFRPSAKVIPRWTRVRGRVVDRASGDPLPRIPMPGYLVTLVYGGSGQVSNRWRACPGVRRQQFTRTGADGRFVFDAWPAQGGADEARFFVQAYDLAEDGRIIRCVDLGKSGEAAKINVNVQVRRRTPLRPTVFPCQELSLVNLYDPRFMLSLGGSLFDAKRSSPFKKFNISFFSGFMAAQIRPADRDARWQLILRAGLTRNRLALVNMASPERVEAEGLGLGPAMEGFPFDQPLPRYQLHLAARDLWRLNQMRLTRYKRAGINSLAIERLEDRTRTLLDEAEAAFARDDGAVYFSRVADATSNEIRAYQAVRDTANDIVRGAIFLLLMLVPFSMAMERLLFANAVIYRQIMATVAIFVVMTTVLWSFHPAFKISNQPLMIVMAFVIICMSLMVLSVVYRKFETGLEEIRSGRAESSGASTSRFNLLTIALRLGIANMRKRKLRTTLTGLTVVLITFALLCFISTSRYTGKKDFAAGGQAAYSGVLVRQAADRVLPVRTLEHLRTTVGQKHPIAPRFWWVNPVDRQWALHVRNPANGEQISLPAALGLAPEEPLAKAWHGQSPHLPQWVRFSQTSGCYLATETAQRLGAEAGDELLVAGQRLELIATFESADLDLAARDLDGQSLLPTDYSALPDEQSRLLAGQSVDVLAEEMQGAGALAPDAGGTPLRAADVIIMPSAILERFADTSLRSVAIVTDQPRSLAHDMAKTLAYPIYYSSDNRVRVVATTPLFPQAPKSLMIPLVIGGLIIFNTMLSSISGRKREIYVYTSLGLAPLHVAFLFLAEAVTYGLMGSVFGYIIGQGAATLFDHFGWLGGITLNYSGSQAVLVMILVLAVVVASSLVPAYLGGRVAAPSSERTWKVPEPKGDLIADSLPFTVTPPTAPGVISFLMDYLDAHREGNIGHFATDTLETFTLKVDGQLTLGLKATVWLAPYDHGVRQQMTLQLAPTAHAEAMRIDVQLQRAAGQPQAWWKLNRVFLGDLRRQLLGWRKVKSERILAHIDSGRRLLGADETGPSHA